MVITRNNFENKIFNSKRSIESIVVAVEEILDNPPNKVLNILDAFCGNGKVGIEVSKYLKAKNIQNKVTFIDINNYAIKQIKHKGTKICTDLRTFIDNSVYDIILVRYGLHDLSFIDKKETINRLSSHLSDQGILVLSDIMPGKSIQNELTKNHQTKEILCDGKNQAVYLATFEEYKKILESENISSKLCDIFFEEVYIKDWLGTLSIDNKTITEFENITLNQSAQFIESLQVFKSKNGVKMYYPIGTIIGYKRNI